MDNKISRSNNCKVCRKMMEMMAPDFQIILRMDKAEHLEMELKLEKVKMNITNTSKGKCLVELSKQVVARLLIKLVNTVVHIWAQKEMAQIITNLGSVITMLTQMVMTLQMMTSFTKNQLIWEFILSFWKIYQVFKQLTQWDTESKL